MVEQVEYIETPLRGLRLDVSPTLMKSEFSTSMLNTKVTNAEIKCRYGYSTIGTGLPLDSSVLGIKQMIKYDGMPHTLILTETGIHYLSGTSTWIDAEGSITWKSNQDYPPMTAFLNNTMIITNGLNDVLEWEGDGDVSAIAGLSGYKCKYLQPFANRLVMGFMTEGATDYSQRIRWTSVGTYDDISSGYANYTDLLATSGHIQALENLGNNLVIYKDDSITQCSFIGGKNVFGFSTISRDIGLASPRAVVNLGTKHIFLAENNIYEYSGGRNLKIISDAVKTEIPSAIDAQYLNRAIGVRYGDEVWFFLPLSGSLPDTVYVYNWRFDQWYTYDVGMTAAGSYFPHEITTIGELEGTIGGLDGSIGAFSGYDAHETVLFGDTDGYVYKHDTVYTDNEGLITNQWDSKDFVLGENYKARYNRLRSIEFDAKGDSVEVLYSTDAGANWVSVGSKSLINTYTWYKLWFDKSVRQVRFRFRNITSGETFSLRTFRILYREGANR